MKIWSILWCLVCGFWPILKLLFTLLSSVALVTKLSFFGSILGPKTNNDCVGNTLEKNVKTIDFKIEKKLHIKHHKIDQILMLFYRFVDVWYAVFDQFWNLYLSYFSQGYGEQNKFFFGSILSQWKTNNFVSNTFEESNVNKSLKNWYKTAYQTS